MTFSPLEPIHLPGGRKLEPLCVLELPTSLVAIARDHATAPPAGVWMLSRDTDEAGAWEGASVDSAPYLSLLIDDVFVLGGVLPPEAVGVRVIEPGGAVHEASEERGAWLIALPIAAFPRWSNRRWRPGVELQWLDADGHVLDYNVPPTYEYRPEPWPRSMR